MSLRAAACALCLALWAAPVAVAAGAGGVAPPALSVTGACLLDEQSGQVLYTFNAEGQLAIASTTKLMTALIVLQHVKHLSQVFTQNNFYLPAGDSQIGLVPGERMSVHDLLLALMLPSADDAAEDLAYNVGGGSVPRFLGMMNAEARRLGLTHTHYTTPSGLDTPGNYSSACDLVHLASYDLQQSAYFKRIVALPSATLLTGSYVRHVINRDDLVAQYPWINGVKTGHTSAAGYVLVSSGTQHGVTLIGSVLGTPSIAARDSNALALLQWGFANFGTERLMKAGDLIARLPVKDRPGYRAAVIAGAGFARLLAHSTVITRRLELPRQLVGPLKRHAVVGRLILLGDGRVLARIPLLLAKRLPAVSALAIAARFMTRPSTLIVAAIVLALAIVAGLAVKRVRARPRRGIILGEIEPNTPA
ncbi:MAG: D-alanyl-D-alanine carboxypeptidase family protein [Solirubrobacteraceae bacterium]